MRASVQSVMNTLWSCSRLLTVSRSSVEWWPDSGATTSTVGCDFITSSALGLSVKRLKRSSRQKGFFTATCSCTATSTPLTVAAVMPNWRLLVFLGQAVHQVEAGRHALGHRRMRERRQRVVVELGRRAGELRERRHQRALGFIQLVEHGRSPRLCRHGVNDARQRLCPG
jgi:hypothetical protein